MERLLEKYMPKPCPWCGETPRIMKRQGIDNGSELHFPYYVMCASFGCEIKPQTGYWKYPDEAVYSWNSMRDKSEVSE